jgi:hypothetical protein
MRRPLLFAAAAAAAAPPPPLGAAAAPAAAAARRFRALSHCSDVARFVPEGVLHFEERAVFSGMTNHSRIPGTSALGEHKVSICNDSEPCA